MNHSAPIGKAPEIAAEADAGRGSPRASRRKESFFEMRTTLVAHKLLFYGVLGALGFFGVWEVGHYITPEASRRFLPSPQHVISTLWSLFAEKDYLYHVLKSLYRIFISFFAACAIAAPIGIAMGCFPRIRALINPTISASRYLPAVSFIPLLLVWFGPTDTQKLALLFLGVVFFLIALILDNTRAVQREFIEAALTMGASRRRVVLGVVVPAAAPSIMDSMRNMIAVGWTYLVIAEIVAASDGIGAVMMRAGRFLKVDIIMAGILTIGVLGMLTDIMFRLAVHFLFPWNRERRG